MVQAIPDEYRRITPYICVKDGKAAIAFYEQAFGAEQKMVMPAGDRVMHAEMVIGDSVLMLSDAFPEMGIVPPPGTGPISSHLMLYVDDVDAVTERAVSLGARLVEPPADQFYGDRTSRIVDPQGHTWTLGTHVKDVSDEEMAAAMAAMA
jgi:PhnB protein